MKRAINPMRPWSSGLQAMRATRRCGARTRLGAPCQGPAMANGRCRMHGGASPGAPQGAANGNYKNGRHTQDARRERMLIANLLRQARQTMRCLEKC